jgi:hypothetical protein
MQNWSTREDGDCLVSTGNNNWLQTDSKRLYVRTCYPALFQECKKLFDGDIQGVFLVGTPGIGKSCFLDYALHHFLHDGQSVLYLDGPDKRAFLFRPDGNTEEHSLRDALEANLADNVPVVLYDPHEHAVQTDSVNKRRLRGKNFIVAMSPDDQNCKKLRKDTRDQATLYMGTLSLEEAEAMRSTCYPHISTELLRTRYATIGGIPRHLFPRLLPNSIDDATRKIEKKQLAALNDIAENPLRIDGGEVASEFKHLWSLYHLQPAFTAAGGIDHYDYTIELSCDSARIRIRDMLMEKEVMDLWNLYVHTMEQHGTLRGIRYEAYGHKKILVQGLIGAAVSLTRAGIGTRTLQIAIPASLPIIHLTDNNLDEHLRTAADNAKNLHTGGYLLPLLPNFPVADSFFVSRASVVILQMKAGRSKPLSDDAASAIQCAVGGNLVFVVPDEVTMTKRFAGGPIKLNQYRFILNETS